MLLELFLIVVIYFPGVSFGSFDVFNKTQQETVEFIKEYFDDSVINRNIIYLPDLTPLDLYYCLFLKK